METMRDWTATSVTHRWEQLGIPVCAMPKLVMTLILLSIGPRAGGLELQCGTDHSCGQLPDMNDPSTLRHFRCVHQLAVNLCTLTAFCSYLPCRAKDISRERKTESSCACDQSLHRCGACHLAVSQLAQVIIRKETLREQAKRLHSDEASALLESFCDTDIGSFGLQLDEQGRPVANFTDDKSKNRATGGWVKRGLVGMCMEVSGSQTRSQMLASMPLTFPVCTLFFVTSDHREDYLQQEHVHLSATLFSCLRVFASGRGRRQSSRFVFILLADFCERCCRQVQQGRGAQAVLDISDITWS